MPNVRAWWIGCLACLCLVSVLTAEDWTEFRGPAGDGHSQTVDLPVTWSPTENVAWKIEPIGRGWSSPVLSQGQLFLTAAVPLEGGTPTNGPQSLHVMAYETRSGSELWDREVFVQDGKRSGQIHGKNSHASPTPIIDGDRLYVHFGTHGTACLDREGNILWKQTQLVYEPRHGNGGSPVLVGPYLIIICDGADIQYVVALNKEDGKIAWKTPRSGPETPKKFCFGTPLVMEVNGQPQVICPGPSLVAAYNPEDGKEIWRVTFDGYSLIPRPVAGHGLVYVCTGYDRPSLLAIKPDGKGDVTDTHVAWKSTKAVPHSASLLLVDDNLYLISDGGVASCLDAKTGEQYWQQRVGGNFSASPVYADGRIYLQDEEGTATVLAPGRTFEELGRNSLKDRTLASYAVGEGAFFIRTEHALYRIQNP